MKARESSRHSFNNCLFYRRFLQLHCVLPTPAPYPFNSLMPCPCQGHAMLFKAHQKNHFTIFRIMNELCLRPGSLASWHLPVYTCLWIWHERALKMNSNYMHVCCWYLHLYYTAHLYVWDFNCLLKIAANINVTTIWSVNSTTRSVKQDGSFLRLSQPSELNWHYDKHIIQSSQTKNNTWPHVLHASRHDQHLTFQQDKKLHINMIRWVWEQRESTS